MIPNGFVMSGDREVARVKDGNILPMMPDLMPVYLQRNNDIEGWLRGRAIDSHRTNSRLLKKALRLTASEDTEVVLRVHAATITDNYWFKEQGSQLCYADVKFKENAFDKLALRGDPDSFNQKPSSTPELTNIGSYEKCWRLSNGTWWMIKQEDESERFSEYFIFLLGRELGFSMAEYELEDDCIKSRDFTNHASVNYEAMYSFVGEDEDYKKSFEILYAQNPAAARDFVRMLYLDTVCFNMDRHTRNYGVLRNIETGEVIGLAPNFDNNIALISRGYPRNLERENDRLIELFAEFLTSSPIAKDFYEEISTDLLTEDLINRLIDQIGFEVDKQKIAAFILNGAEQIQKII